MTVRIVAVAIVFGTEVWIGDHFKERHAHVIHRHVMATGKSGSGHQGFLGSDGQFYGRREALSIADHAGQLLRPAGLNEAIGLFSEDVW